MSEVRDTSLKTYDEIKEEGIYDSRMEEVLTAIRSYPLMTGREYALLILGYQDMNIVRPRISDLSRLGYILDIGKRKCSCGGRLSYVWATRESIEKRVLKKLEFKETQKNLFMFKEDDITLYQDFRKGSRCSYAINDYNCNVSHSCLTIHKKFKEELLKYFNQSL